MRTSPLTITVLALAITGCSHSTSSSTLSSAVVPPSPTISGLPVSINVKQRSTSAIPGSSNELSLTADDVTRGQVMVSVVRNKGEALFGPVSMKTGEFAEFHFGDADYSLKLVELNDALIGEDFASFVISDVNSEALTEKQKIDRLIAAVEALDGAVFLRNGAEHSPKDAAEHLRRKLRSSHRENDFGISIH